MLRAQTFELRLHVIGQGIVSGAHVGEFRVRRHRRHDHREQHRVAPRRVLEGRIRVPQAVAQQVLAPPVVRLEDLTALAHIGNIRQRLVAEAVFRDRRRAGLGVKLAVEALREFHLLPAGKGLLAEDQYRVAVHARADLLQGVAVGDRSQIDRARLQRRRWDERI